MSKPNLPEIAEIGSVIGSVVATVPAFIYNQAAVACVPLSLALALNLFNRKSLVAKAEQIAQQSQIPAELASIPAEVSLVRQQYSNIQSEVGQLQLSTSKLGKDGIELRSEVEKLAAPIASLQQSSAQAPQADDNIKEAIAKLEAEQSRSNTELLGLQEQLSVAQTLNAQLFQLAQQWEKQHESWELEKAALNEKINEKVNSWMPVSLSHHQALYESGLKHSEMQEWKAALGDYNKAIEINQNYAEAYRERGLAKAKLQDKHGAVADLRKAAQLFFNRGDIDSYHQTKDITKNLHEFNILENSLQLEPATVQNLFS